MEFFRKKTHIDFLGIRKWAGLLSLVLVTASLLCIFTKGLNWGLDFTGGYAIQMQYAKAPNLTVVRNQLEGAGFHHFNVITFGSTHDIRITLAPKAAMKKETVSLKTKTEQEKLVARVHHVLGAGAEVMSVSYTGPAVGAELAQRGMLAMLIAVLATMAYIALRFEMRFAVSSAIALAHDPVLILGIFSLFQFRFDLTALAAVLAVIGYSLNDTVVIYDRIRENFRKMRKSTVTEVVNRAVNDTLSRTVMTSGLTLVVVVVLFFLGGPTIHYFALALIIGIVVGTYSSIYVAGALAVMMGLDRNALMPAKKQVDDMP
jgi:preprotein translocase subunit SecF